MCGIKFIEKGNYPFRVKLHNYSNMFMHIYTYMYVIRLAATGRHAENLINIIRISIENTSEGSVIRLWVGTFSLEEISRIYARNELKGLYRRRM